MTKEESILFLDYWAVGTSKVFTLKNYWPLPKDEIIILNRLDKHNFKCDADKSTINIKYCTNTEVKNLLVKGDLVESPYASCNVNYRDERNGGCYCGAWATSFPKHHIPGFGCRDYTGKF